MAWRLPTTVEVFIRGIKQCFVSFGYVLCASVLRATARDGFNCGLCCRVLLFEIKIRTISVSIIVLNRSVLAFWDCRVWRWTWGILVGTKYRFGVIRRNQRFAIPSGFSIPNEGAQ